NFNRLTQFFKSISYLVNKMHHRHIKKDSGSEYQFNKSGKASGDGADDTNSYQSEAASAEAADSASAEPGLVGRLAGGVASAATSTATYGWGAMKWGASIGASATGAVASRLPVVNRFVGSGAESTDSSTSGSGSGSRGGGQQDKKKE
ncbi:hypothetical protein BOX15_Mlig015287g4, partial [Macrostomum lignano]